MGTATRRAQAMADKRSALSFASDQNAAKRELVRMGSLWLKRHPNPKQFHKPKQAPGMVMQAARRPSVVSV